MTWLEASAAWRRAKTNKGYQFIMPTRAQLIMFFIAISVHIAFNLLYALVAGL